MNLRPSADKRFPLEIAERIAQALLEKLAPFCEWIPLPEIKPLPHPNGPYEGGPAIKIAGSIRRRRPDVGDIDLVAIPKLEQVTTGLFTTETQRPRDSRLAVEFCALTGKLMARGDSIIRGHLDPSTLQHFNISTPVAPIGVDLYLCTPETWATTLLIRTGSAAHNIWLCQRARAMGGKLHADGSGLELPGQYDPREQRTVNTRRVAPRDEADIFSALLQGPEVYTERFTPFGIRPELREVQGGIPAWMECA